MLKGFFKLFFRKRESIEDILLANYKDNGPIIEVHEGVLIAKFVITHGVFTVALWRWSPRCGVGTRFAPCAGRISLIPS